MAMIELNYSLKAASQAKEAVLKKADDLKKAADGSVDILIDGKWVPLSEAKA